MVRRSALAVFGLVGVVQVMMPLTHEHILRYFGSFHHQARSAWIAVRHGYSPSHRTPRLRAAGLSWLLIMFTIFHRV